MSDAGGGPRFGNVGRPGQAVMYCPRCRLVAVPIAIREHVVECSGCHARLAVYSRRGDGRAAKV